MATTAIKSAEDNGKELGRKFASVFVVRDDAEYQAKVELGMYFATQQGLDLQAGAAYVNGFVYGISGNGRKTVEMTLEEKVDVLLKREIERRLPRGPADSDRSSGADKASD